MHRAATMAFVPSVHVFPGGGVDPRDAQEVPWFGPSPAQWSELIGTDTESAQMVVTAAIREVFEETGVLLAGPDGDSVAEPTSTWLADRQALEQRTLSFAQFLRREHLVLRSDLLGYRAHWTTPEFEPRRYDTRFFAARMPVGQLADGQSAEAQSVSWSRPIDLLDGHTRGELGILPPTLLMLEELATESDIDHVVTSRSDVPDIMPRVVEHDGALVLRVDRR